MKITSALLAGLLSSLMIARADDASQCLNRTVLVNVLDANGMPIRDLGGTNFRASLRGGAVQVLSAVFEGAPRRVVLIIDTSGSMKDKSPKAVMLAKHFLASIKREVPIALLTFANQVETRISFDPGHGAVAQALNDFERTSTERSKGFRKTALRDAIMAGLALLKPAALGDAVCVITDGGENASKTKSSQLKKALLFGGVRVFVLLLPSNPNRGRIAEETYGPAELRELAWATGGWSLGFPPVSDMGGDRHWRGQQGEQWLLTATRSFYSQMFGFFQLKLLLPEAVDKPKRLDVAVVDKQGKKIKNREVVYPGLLAPCGD